jgi:hypothetical protein
MMSINKAKIARLATAAAFSAATVLSLTTGTANARWGDDRHDWNYGWTGGYWVAPPVVYGSPYGYGYYPPPVGVGINLPGVSIGIQ